MKTRIILTKGEHRGKKIVLMQFPCDDTSIKIIRSKYFARRSATRKLWHDAAEQFNPHEFMEIM